MNINYKKLIMYIINQMNFHNFELLLNIVPSKSSERDSLEQESNYL